MSISFGDAFAEATGVSPPSDLAAQRGTAFGGAIPPLSERGFLDAALWWAAYIGGVFPLDMARPDVDDDRAKRLHPHMGDGGEWDRPSRDPEQIARWWSTNDTGMLCNIGFAPQPAGILIIDIDPRAGGGDAWRALCREHGIDDSDCGRVESPRGDGGVHLWWKLPDGVEYIHAPIVHGVDRPWQTPIPPSVRYVLLDAHAKDPTRKFGFRSYRWTSGDPRALPIAHDVLLAPPDTMLPSNATQTNATPASGGASGTTVGGAGQRVPIQALVGQPVPVGQQSYTFKRIACSMIARGYNDEVIIGELLRTADVSPIGDDTDPWTRHGMELLVRACRRFVDRSRAQEATRNAQFAANLLGGAS